eukprot:jgi/Chrzof1/779/Cz01g28160.t1
MLSTSCVCGLFFRNLPVVGQSAARYAAAAAATPQDKNKADAQKADKSTALETAGPKDVLPKPSQEIAIHKKDWSAVKVPEKTIENLPTITAYGQAFLGDIRSTSGLGLGDGIFNHTKKWLQVSLVLAAGAV